MNPQPHHFDLCEALPGLAAVLVKDGVSLGGLSEAQRSNVLAWVWAGLPQEPSLEPNSVPNSEPLPKPLTEREVNAALKRQLTGAAVFLATDHVELRRWLCDGGWLARDAWGRAYRRVAAEGLPEHQRARGLALQAAAPQPGRALDTEACTALRRAQHHALRSARRQAHASAASGQAASASARGQPPRGAPGGGLSAA